MVINNFNFFRTGIRPTKAKPPLIVDTNTVLSSATTPERFKTIAGRYPQIIQSIRDFKLPELAPCNLGNIYKLFDRIAF